MFAHEKPQKQQKKQKLFVTYHHVMPLHFGFVIC